MINLLPNEYKKELENIKKYKIILIIEILFIFFLISLVLFLFLINIHIKERIIELKLSLEPSELKNENFQTLKLKNKAVKEKIIPINKTLSELSAFYQNQINISEIIKDFPIPPPGISLNGFLFDKDSSSSLVITVSGKASTRESLFQFKKQLEEKEFSEVYVPWSNLIELENIDFTITLRKKR